MLISNLNQVCFANCSENTDWHIYCAVSSNKRYQPTIRSIPSITSHPLFHIPTKSRMHFICINPRLAAAGCVNQFIGVCSFPFSHWHDNLFRPVSLTRSCQTYATCHLGNVPDMQTRAMTAPRSLLWWANIFPWNNFAFASQATRPATNNIWVWSFCQPTPSQQPLESATPTSHT